MGLRCTEANPSVRTIHRLTATLAPRSDRDQDGEINQAEFMYIMKQSSVY